MPIDIAAKKVLHDYHTVLYKLMGIATDFVSESGENIRLLPAEHVSPLCAMISGTECGSVACRKIGMEMMRKSRVTGKSIIYECHAGLIDVTIPIFVNKKFLGCLTCGQILKKKPTKKTFREFKARLAHLKLDEKKLRDYYFKAVVLSEKQIEAMAELMSLVGNYIVESENKLLFLASVNENNKVLFAREYIEQNYRKDISIADISHGVNLSESHFSHQFKKEVGTSMVQYLNRFRTDKAKELLQSSTLNITEIAAETGFASLPHFNRIFKKFEQVSPSEFRKKQKRLNNQR
jgi:AraC-like DNA-binding protein/ligand-binding sensor protein